MKNIDSRIERLEALLNKGIMSEITLEGGTVKRLDILETLDILLDYLCSAGDEPRQKITAVKWMGGKSKYGRMPELLRDLIAE